MNVTSSSRTRPGLGSAAVLLLALFLTDPLSAVTSSSRLDNEASAPLVIGQVTANDRDIVFSQGGRLWRVPRSGGRARRVTESNWTESHPHFSPDGRHLAFSASRARNQDVYVMPADGGEPRRLTFHSKHDRVKNWSADSRTVLFASRRDDDAFMRLYTISLDDVMPRAIDLQEGFDGALSPDGSQLAYLPRARVSRNWRYYRGGMAGPLWVLDLAGGEYDEIVGEGSNESFPMWRGDTLFFVSDLDGTKNLYAYHFGNRSTRQLTRFSYYGIDSADATGDGIVLLCDGRLHFFDLAAGRLRPVPLTVPENDNDDERKPKQVSIRGFLESAAISRDGSRLVFGARGDVVLYEIAEGAATNLTQSSASAERFPVLSPDGRSVAYFSDETGEYALHVRSISEGSVRRIDVEARPGFYREPAWSPDSTMLSFSSQRNSLYLADLAGGSVRAIDGSDFLAQLEFNASWSPDSRWIVYSKALPTGVKTLFLAEVRSGKKVQITDGTAHCEFPVFDKSGAAIFFSASYNAHRGAANKIWGLQSAIQDNPQVVMNLAMVLLRDDRPSPIFPQSARPNPDGKLTAAGGPIRVDLEGIQDRIFPLPAPQKVIQGISAGRIGEIYLRTLKWPDTPATARSFATPLYSYRIDSPRKLEPVVEDVDNFLISADASRIYYAAAGKFHYRDLPQGDSGESEKAEDREIDLAAVRIEVDPGQEWRQMYREAWRMMRDYFYDPNHHGQNLAALEKHYAAYLPSIERRSDLNLLLRSALGNVSVSHLGVGGGDTRRGSGERPERIGFLGADYEVAEGLYRFKRILRSGHFLSSSSFARAPLDQPGIDVHVGDYLLEIEGRPVTAEKNLYQQFAGTARKPVLIKVGPNPDGSRARQYTVMPTTGENTLRRTNWALQRKEIVERLSGGRLSYVYIGGYNFGYYRDFDRVFSGGRDSDGLIIDQRYNGGGITSDAMIEALQRSTIYYYDFRYGADLRVPMYSIHGPKVLVINSYNGSAAETFPHMFKLRRVGDIVGTRTLGGGIGGALYSQRLIDGGRIRIPNRAAYDPVNKDWGIENQGVSPDVPVAITPRDWRAGRDPQLEKAVQVALERLLSYPPLVKNKPDPPVHPGDGTVKKEGQR